MSNKLPPASEQPFFDPSSSPEANVATEKLAAITEQLASISDMSELTTYSVHDSFIPPSQADRLFDSYHIDMRSVGGLDASNNAWIKLTIPSKIPENIDSPFTDSYVMFENTNGTVTGKIITTEKTQDLLANVQSVSDLPDSARQIITAAATLLNADNLRIFSRDATNIPIDLTQFKQLWENVRANMSSKPIETDLDWNSQEGIALPGGKTLFGIRAVGLLSEAGHDIISMNVDTSDYLFYQFHYDDNPPETGFQATKTDAIQLTLEQLRDHPFSVVSQEYLTQGHENVTQLPGVQPAFYIYDKHDQAVRKDMGTFSDITKAQYEADQLFMKRLGYENTDRTLTVERADTVLETLDAAMKYMQTNGQLPKQG